MTKNELQADLEKKTGLKLVPVGCGEETRPLGKHNAEYHVVSPSGMKMFIIGIYHVEQGWEVGNVGTVCREIWEAGRHE